MSYWHSVHQKSHTH